MREIVSLNHKWAFTKEELPDPAQLPRVPYWVNLPHTWNAIDGQDGGGDYHRGACWYVKELALEELPRAQRYYLEFRGANASAAVYVNGRMLARHDGGYSTWRVEVTQALQARNVLAVRVDNSAGEQVYPQMADFTFYGGLYRDVRMICVGDSHFDLMYFGSPGIAVTPEVVGQDADIRVQVHLTDEKPEQKLRFVLLDAQGRRLAESTVDAAHPSWETSIRQPRLWRGRRDPYLYTVQAELLEEGEAIDRVSARFGCRSFRIDPDQGFMLNGERYPLRGVSRHQDRWGIGNALLPEHHREDIDLICEMGANTVRLAHYQHDQAFYDLCDERGLVVWAEIPYISKHLPEGVDNTLQQMRELIVQNYNHPSIVVWGLSNEITMGGENDPGMVENHRRLNDLCHALDKTRPTTLAVLSMCDIHAPYIRIPDTVAYNHYFGWYGGETSMNGPWFDRFHQEFPDIPIGLSEYGCEALNWHSSQPIQGDYTEEYQAYYHEELIRQIAQRPYLWATYVWNMFDFGADNRSEGGENGQNHKGLVTFDRRYKKDAFYAYKAWLSDEPFVHIAGKRYVDRVEAVTRVTVYSNQPEVELLVNGRSLGKQRREDHFFRFEVPNQGVSLLTALAGKCRDESRIRKVETFNESYRLREKGAVLNWFDVEAPEGYFSLQDKVSDIQRNPQGSVVLGQLMKQMVSNLEGKGPAGFEMSPAMMEMMGAFTVLRLTSLMGAAGAKVTREQLLALNAQLNRIPKA